MNNLIEGNTRFIGNSKDNLPWDTATIAKGHTFEAVSSSGVA